MPLCTCGKKVDRTVTSKLKIMCTICNEFFHAECLNIGESEFGFIKDSYKCEVCEKTLSSHRYKNDVGVVVFNKSLPSNDVRDATATNDVAGDVVVTKSNAFSLPTDAANSHVVGVNKCSDRNICLLDSDPDHLSSDMNKCERAGFVDKNAFEKLSGELLLLRKANSELNKQVSSLRDDNVRLESKLDVVLNMLNELQLAANCTTTKVSSPKRKKLSNITAKKSQSISNSKINNLINTTSANGHNVAENSLTNIAHTSELSPNDNVSDTSALTFAAVASSAATAVTPLAAVNLTTQSSNFNWTVVGKKSNSNALVGTCANNDLGVVNKFKWLHLSSFKSSVCEKDIISFVSKSSNISDKHFACFKLIKKDENIADRKFVNFKLGIISCYYSKVYNRAVWPANIRVRPFVNLDNKSKPIPEPSPSPAPEPSSAPTPSPSTAPVPALETFLEYPPEHPPGSPMET